VFDDDLIPSHSHLFGAWVEAGIFGGVFWFWLLLLSVRALYAAVNIRTGASLIIAFCMFLLIWDVLFSPFGAYERFQAAGKICLAMWAISMTREGRGVVRSTGEVQSSQ
jgi:hypothetical protein